MYIYKQLYFHILFNKECFEEDRDVVKEFISNWNSTVEDLKSRAECKQKCQETHQCKAFVYNKEVQSPTCDIMTFGSQDKIKYSPDKTFGFKYCRGNVILYIFRLSFCLSLFKFQV